LAGERGNEKIKGVSGGREKEGLYGWRRVPLHPPLAAYLLFFYICAVKLK